MTKIQSEDIYIFSRHSNLKEEDAKRALKEFVYNGGVMWHKFLGLLLMCLGIGFTVAGVIFFFAYNWDDLHKFVKLGITGGMIIATTVLVLSPALSVIFRQIILTAASILVGAMFAVFGQIYQTGANAFDFFLAWAIFVTLWALVSNFAPHWLLYLVLVSTTIVLYSQQMARDWNAECTITILFCVCFLNLVLGILGSKFKTTLSIPNWYLKTLVLLSATEATCGIITIIFSSSENQDFPVLCLLTAVAYAFGIWYGLKSKSGFYLSVISFSLITIISALFLKGSDESITFLMTSVFIVASVTFTIKFLINLQKKWRDEK